MMKPRIPIDWNTFFMSAAKLSSLRSKDPDTQVGAAIVKDKKVIGLGYNGFPSGIADSEFPWVRGDKLAPLFETKNAYSHHAEQNAISNRIEPVRGATLYSSVFPCNICAPILITYGISTVVYMSEKYMPKEITDLDISDDLSIPEDELEQVQWLYDAKIPYKRFTGDSITLDLQFKNTELKEFDRTKRSGYNPQENTDFISWDSYFMGLAVLNSLKSKVPFLQEGSCLVGSDNRVQSMGYNGLPRGFNDEAFDWEAARGSSLGHLLISSVINTMANAGDRSHYSTLYTTHFPNHGDVRFIIPQDIRKVVYGFDQIGDSYIAARRMLEAADIQIEKFQPDTFSLELDLSGSDTSSRGDRGY